MSTLNLQLIVLEPLQDSEKKAFVPSRVLKMHNYFAEVDLTFATPEDAQYL